MRKTTIFALAMVVLAAAAWAQTAQEFIRKGDEFYAAFDDAKALEQYKQALALEPENYEALWKASRGLVDTADLIVESGRDAKETKKKLYGEAESLARRATRANPGDTWGFFQLSASMGKRLLLLGTKEQVDASKKVREAIDKAIALDPSNDLAHHALGRWHRRMAEIGGAKRFFGGLIYGSIPKGSFTESEQALLKAVELKPDYILHHLELGRTYVSLEKKDLATREFQACIDMPSGSSKDGQAKDEARAEMESLNKKK